MCVAKYVRTKLKLWVPSWLCCSIVGAFLSFAVKLSFSKTSLVLEVRAQCSVSMNSLVPPSLRAGHLLAFLFSNINIHSGAWRCTFVPIHWLDICCLVDAEVAHLFLVCLRTIWLWYLHALTAVCINKSHGCFFPLLGHTIHWNIINK